MLFYCVVCAHSNSFLYASLRRVYNKALMLSPLSELYLCNKCGFSLVQLGVGPCGFRTYVQLLFSSGVIESLLYIYREKGKIIVVFFRLTCFRRVWFRPENGTFLQILGVPTGEKTRRNEENMPKRRLSEVGHESFFL